MRRGEARPAQGTAFRALSSDQLSPGQDASECCLVFADFRREHFDRVLLNPNVRVAYEWPHYNLYRYGMPWAEWAFRLFNRVPAASTLAAPSVKPGVNAWARPVRRNRRGDVRERKLTSLGACTGAGGWSVGALRGGEHRTRHVCNKLAL